MAEPLVFQSIHDSSLYTLAADAGVPGWIGFVAVGSSSPAQLPFAATWLNGYYLFAAKAPVLADTKAANDYAATVQNWLNTQFNNGNLFSGAACIWLANADGPQFGPPEQSAITIFQLLVAATGNDFNFPIGQLTLSITNQTTVSLGADSLSFSGGGQQKVSFTTTDLMERPTVVGGAQIPFTGPRGGSITLAGTLTRSGESSTIGGLQTGFHYVRPQAGSTDLLRQYYPLLTVGAGLAVLPYVGAVDPLDPFNRNAPLSSAADGRFRTLFGLATTAGPTPIASWFTAFNGQPLDLVPLNPPDDTGAAALWCGALVPQPRLDIGGPSGRIYLAPAGDFAVLPRGGTPGQMSVELLPGLFGNERLILGGFDATPETSRLRFVPNCAAYAPVFPYLPATLDDPGLGKRQKRLDTTWTTAYAAVLGPAAKRPAYLAQPDGSPLYAPPDGAAAATTGAPLPPLPTPAPIPQSGPTAGLTLLPFVPYAGLGVVPQAPVTADLGTFESQIIAAARKETLRAASISRVASAKAVRLRNGLRATPGAAVKQSTTPQGLYAEVEVPAGGGDTLYHAVTLAKSHSTSGATFDFGFEELSAELQDLFQTNQLMSVIVNPAKLGTLSPFGVGAPAAGTPVFHNGVVIADWRMTAAVGTSLNTTAYSNILILKFCDGTLLERIANPNKWVGSADFSIPDGGGGDPASALTGLSTYLQTTLTEAIARADTDPLYRDFARIVQDPNWQGFLVLGAKVDPSGFPDQIKGLIAGIDFSLFQAHHFGATASRVTVSGQTVSMEVPSSLFALIDYQLPAYRAAGQAGSNPDMPLPIAAESDFNFEVLQLQALFRNAALVDFKSRVQLTIGRLFGSPVETAYGAIGTDVVPLPATGVVLNGSYQLQGGTGVYVFEQNALTRFSLDSNALAFVTTTRVVFNTLSNGAGDGIVRSRFLLSGSLEFTLLTASLPDKSGTIATDLLSFGLPPDAEPTMPSAGLSFSGLEVSMSSPVDAPNAVTFAFEAAKLALDQGASQPRAHSLFADMALQVDSFIVGSEDKRPINFGFLPVSVPPKLKAISGPWFGIVYKVTMGGPGALVASAGFTSRMILAWAPTATARDAAASVFVGLQLPGAAPGAKLLSIQGVLKLSIDSLTLRREQVTGEEMSFTLRLNNVGLTFLGIAKIPTSAAMNFFLFGDPSGNGSLGWYAAYVANAKSQTSPAADDPGVIDHSGAAHPRTAQLAPVTRDVEDLVP